ncbi:MAG: GspE/PulE family protein [Candidatus Omnitrophota bacterium]
MDESIDKREEKKTDDFVVDKSRLESLEKADNFLAGESYALKLVKHIIVEAIDKRASDIFVEPLEKSLRIRYRVDGLLCDAGTYSIDDSPYIVSALKVLAGLDIAEHRFPQDGRFRFKVQEKIVDFRVSVITTNLGEKLVMRVLDKSRIELDLDSLGFDEEGIAILKRNLKKPYGMILVCGPTGGGKTTTLYSCLKFIDSVDVNIVTVEDPIEFQLSGINQVAVQDGVGLTFAAALRSILRQDPDIILVGEIRDFETADIAVKASLTGHLVLSTLHTTTAPAAVVRFINMGIEPFLVASSCLVTASQALFRVLCPNCKRETEVSEILREELKLNNLSIPKDFKYYQPVGCGSCSNTGFLGRKAIIEVLELDQDIKDLLVHNETEAKIREVAVKKGMKTLREKALRKLLEGTTTIEEVYRVTMGG